MTKIDKALSAMIVGTVPPVSLLLLLWWGSIPFIKDERIIMFLSMTGFAAGLILDMTVLRRFLYKLYDFPLKALVGLHIFYSILIYGFFMGFPVFNIFTGIAGTYIVARKCTLKGMGSDDTVRNIKFMIKSSTVVLLCLCIATAVLALTQSTICSEVKRMLGLSFDVTFGMIWGLILAGGSALLLFQYYISKAVASKAVKQR